METTSGNNESGEQSREEAMAETQELLSHADGWAVLAAAQDAAGDLCGGSKLFIEPEALEDVIVAAALNQPEFGRAVVRAAIQISRLINLHADEHGSKQGTTAKTEHLPKTNIIN